MKDHKKYFQRYGCLYGDSYKFEFGKWHHSITKFTSLEEAEKWFVTEQRDFRTREFITKSEAKSYGYK